MHFTSLLTTAVLALTASTVSADVSPMDFIAYLAQKQSPPQMPQSSLAAPGSLTLQYVALGMGTQNYSCATSDSSSVPVAIGALANLYDAYELLEATASASNQNSVTYLPCAADHMNNNFGLRQLGLHYFNSAGVPSFDLSMGTTSPQYPQGKFLSSKKVGDQAAPSSACTGRNGAAAVDWLMLQDNGQGISRGLSQVYRLETAGGKAPTNCQGQPQLFTVDYAAEYWFYD